MSSKTKSASTLRPEIKEEEGDQPGVKDNCVKT